MDSSGYIQVPAGMSCVNALHALWSYAKPNEAMKREPEILDRLAQEVSSSQKVAQIFKNLATLTDGWMFVNYAGGRRIKVDFSSFPRLYTRCFDHMHAGKYKLNSAARALLRYHQKDPKEKLDKWDSVCFEKLSQVSYSLIHPMFPKIQALSHSFTAAIEQKTNELQKVEARRERLLSNLLIRQKMLKIELNKKIMSLQQKLEKSSPEEYQGTIQSISLSLDEISGRLTQNQKAYQLPLQCMIKSCNQLNQSITKNISLAVQDYQSKLITRKQWRIKIIERAAQDGLVDQALSISCQPLMSHVAPLWNRVQRVEQNLNRDMTDIDYLISGLRKKVDMYKGSLSVSKYLGIKAIPQETAGEEKVSAEEAEYYAVRIRVPGRRRQKQERQVMSSDLFIIEESFKELNIRSTPSAPAPAPAPVSRWIS